jgi:hypothetical protein
LKELGKSHLQSGMKQIKHILIFLVIVVVAVASAQVRFGKIKGTVIDHGGGTMPGTKITFQSGKIKHDLETNDDGEFEIDLPVGIYRVTAKADGYKKSKLSQVEVTEGTTNSIELRLVPTVDQNIY